MTGTTTNENVNLNADFEAKKAEMEAKMAAAKADMDAKKAAADAAFEAKKAEAKAKQIADLQARIDELKK